ncbi:hypothetical protein BDQ12DRAFT_686862 [Crucibulum laeve]|uniref:Uncharacterized protein n=1 Tax=Crucibulum laeve TaxID=68775 RepID=A0A5C3LUG7_9AGAR|nr:hypothetical protein BDQ12DRAFT_686862 [Crucibulum laeve]
MQSTPPDFPDPRVLLHNRLSTALIIVNILYPALTAWTAATRPLVFGYDIFWSVFGTCAASMHIFPVIFPCRASLGNVDYFLLSEMAKMATTVAVLACHHGSSLSFEKWIRGLCIVMEFIGGFLFLMPFYNDMHYLPFGFDPFDGSLYYRYYDKICALSDMCGLYFTAGSRNDARYIALSQSGNNFNVSATSRTARPRYRFKAA